MSLSSLARPTFWLSLICLILAPFLSKSENRLSLREVELTPQLLTEVTPKLSNPATAAEIDVLDKLVFGSGNVVKVEGKSRKFLLLTLDSAGKQIVKLFDLPRYDLEDLELKGLIYFNGVLSKIEPTAQGSVEVSISYSRISSGSGHAYSEQAKTFVVRNWESQRQNREILGQDGKQVPTATPSPTQPPSPSTSGDATRVANSGKTPESGPKAATAGGAVKVGEEDDDDRDSEEPVNKPVLLRRGRSQIPKPSQPAGTSQTQPGSSKVSLKEDDVVIYRKNTDAGSPSQGVEAQVQKEQDGMMLIPEGYVTLGSDDVLDKEKPLHRVFVKAFYMDKHEVTNKEFKEFCDATGHRIPSYWKAPTLPKDFPGHPVAYIKWQDALAYAKWVGKRLPTEAEWERAAKGPHSYRYSYGNAYDAQKANTESKKTTPVGTYAVSDFGLYDMTGNVAEWTSSLFQPYPYKADDGREDLQATGPRVLRGGNNSSGETGSRCLVRAEGAPDDESPSVGFRCARDAN